MKRPRNMEIRAFQVGNLYIRYLRDVLTTIIRTCFLDTQAYELYISLDFMSSPKSYLYFRFLAFTIPYLLQVLAQEFACQFQL